MSLVGKHSLIGGSLNSKKKRNIITTTEENDDTDDHFKRVHDHNKGEVPAALEDDMRSGANKEFKSSAELDNISADELAGIVLDPDDPSMINLAHSAFRFPREHWDKILTSAVFD